LNEVTVIEQVDQARKLDWVNIAFLSLTPVIGIAGTALYTWRNGFEPWMLGLFVVMYALVGLSITAGYHRFFSHKSYEAALPVQIFYAIFGALAAQNSILWWSASHRVHHKYVDQDWDPYNIRRGFWWAHIFWIFYRNPDAGNFDNSPDLLKNPVVMWQHRWHKVIMVVVGFGLPTMVGALFGDAWAGLLWGGFLRVAVIHHTTFFVNSLAHFWGARTFSAENSARDNGFVALLTLGEGYHSFHHRFANDFRNGIRWYHWDPSKWFILGLRGVGLATDLRLTPAPMVEKAKMLSAFKAWQEKIDAGSVPHHEEIRRRFSAAVEAIEHSFELWRQHLNERAQAYRGWRETRRTSKQRLRYARREWRGAMRLLKRHAA
jgi:stearoyl-CoA desaturase (delta-9 desaturase)